MIRVCKESELRFTSDTIKNGSGRYVMRGADGVVYYRSSIGRAVESETLKVNSDPDFYQHYKQYKQYPKQQYEVFLVSNPTLDFFDMLKDTFYFLCCVFFCIIAALLVYLLPYYIYSYLFDNLTYRYRWLSVVIPTFIPLLCAYWFYTKKRYVKGSITNSISDDRIFIMISRVILCVLVGIYSWFFFF